MLVEIGIWGLRTHAAHPACGIVGISLFLFILRILERKPWWKILVTAALVTAGNYLLFVTWLGMSLPKGIFD